MTTRPSILGATPDTPPIPVSLTFVESATPGLVPEEMELREELSQLFECRLLLRSTDHALDAESLVGEHVQVELPEQPFLSAVHGIVRSVHQLTAEPTGVSRYELCIVPPLWLTTQRRDHRIFQHLTVPEIVAAVMAGYGGSVPAPVVRTAPRPPREYTVQYGETDHDFVFRLLADDGITSFFDHEAGSAFTLVDDTTRLTPSVSDGIPFAPSSNLRPAGPFVSAVSIHTRARTGQVALRAYDFRRPHLPLDASATAGERLLSNEPVLEAYEFAVDEHVSQQSGTARAVQRLEEARAGSRRVLCTTSFALGAGARFTLFNHPRSDCDGSLLVVRATTTWDGRPAEPTATHTLECMDAGTPFRPARRDKPRVHGTQTAFVVGTAGQEIDVDSFGRVEVEFRWDRRDRHAGGIGRRVRVSQGWAGAGFGMMLLPRVGEEVIVTYLDGDPDEPLIVGRVHNALAVTPLNLPAEKTQSVWRSRSSPGGRGFNEIRMEDAAGAEVLSTRAERDQREVVGHDRSAEVGNDDFTLVKNTHTVAVSHAAGDRTASIVMRDERIVLDTGAGATITLEGDKISLEATTIELLARDFIDFQGKKRGIGLQTPAGATSISGPEFLFTGDRFAVSVSSLAALSAASVSLGGETVSITASGTTDIGGTPVQLNGGGPFAGRVTELAPATITTGAALVLIGGPSFPFTVEKLPNGDLKIGNAMIVTGKTAFQGKVLARLGVISTTPSGMALLGSLDSSGKTMTIKQFNGDNSFAGPDDFAAATPKGQPVFDGEGKPILGPDGKQLVGTGTGSDVTVEINPDLTLEDINDPTHPLPNDAVLFHEMNHGDHMMHGTYDGAPDPNFDTKEEKRTILTGKPSEADYGKERHLGHHRTDHDSTFAPD